MYIITAKDGFDIMGIGNALDYMSNGYPRLINENIAFVSDIVDVYNLETVPPYVEAEKYCYTKADGFYPNPNWHEPSAYDLAPQEVVDAIIDEYTNELIEMGVL